MKELISRLGAIPIAFIDNPSDILPLCDALTAGGLPMLEVLLRTPSALDAIRLAVNERPDFTVGAGTLLSIEQAKGALDAGAKFAVSPGFNPNVTRYCIANGLPIIPGTVTPTEIEAALELGLTVLKFFPAAAYGGPSAIKELSGPYPTVGFVPTGGMSQKHLEEYLAVKSILAIGGTWMCNSDMIAAGRFDEIERICRETVDVVRRIRPVNADK